MINQPPEPTEVHSFSSSHAAKAAARLITALAVLVALAACGGSGSDEPDKTIDPLLCLHRPQVCK